MCLTVVRFTPKEKRTVEEYAALLRKMMPVFQNAAGLKRKYFIKTEQGSAGIYEWESEQHARATSTMTPGGHKWKNWRAIL